MIADHAIEVTHIIRLVGIVASAMMVGESIYLSVRLFRRRGSETEDRFREMWMGAGALISSTGVLALSVAISRTGRLVSHAPFTWLDVTGLVATTLGAWSLYMLAKLDAHLVQRRKEKEA